MLDKAQEDIRKKEALVREKSADIHRQFDYVKSLEKVSQELKSSNSLKDDAIEALKTHINVNPPTMAQANPIGPIPDSTPTAPNQHMGTNINDFTQPRPQDYSQSLIQHQMGLMQHQMSMMQHSIQSSINQQHLSQMLANQHLNQLLCSLPTGPATMAPTTGPPLQHYAPGHAPFMGPIQQAHTTGYNRATVSQVPPMFPPHMAPTTGPPLQHYAPGHASVMGPLQQAHTIGYNRAAVSQVPPMIPPHMATGPGFYQDNTPLTTWQHQPPHSYNHQARPANSYHQPAKQTCLQQNTRLPYRSNLAHQQHKPAQNQPGPLYQIPARRDSQRHAPKANTQQQKKTNPQNETNKTTYEKDLIISQTLKDNGDSVKMPACIDAALETGSDMEERSEDSDDMSECGSPMPTTQQERDMQASVTKHSKVDNACNPVLSQSKNWGLSLPNTSR